ncbi:hypothetical protein LEMLEM_LOCUS27300, partial [Lemmus lemmus]
MQPGNRHHPHWARKPHGGQSREARTRERWREKIPGWRHSRAGRTTQRKPWPMGRQAHCVTPATPAR